MNARSDGAPFSVIVCTVDRPGPLERAIAGILAESDFVREIWIMDQGADDRAGEMLRRRFSGDARIRHVRLPFRHKSRAANEAAQRAAGELLAFTDDDCEPAAGWLAGLQDAFRRNPAAALVVGEIVPDSAPSTLARAHTSPDAVIDGTNQFERLGICGGGNMAVRRDVFLRLGGFDERMGPGAAIPAGEDLDFFYRVIAGGAAAVRTSAASVRHFSLRLDGAGSRRRVAREYISGAAGFHLKHLRCGDARAGRRLVAYARDGMAFHASARSARAALAHLFWTIVYAAKHAGAPLSRERRMYAAD
jgi:glycosyltransferase involved in cell wall biosynthesis